MTAEERRTGVSRPVVVLIAAACLLGVGNSAMNAVSIIRIQASRQDTILRSCEESNMRHDQTFAELDRLLLVRLSGVSVDARTDPRLVDRRLTHAIARLPEGRRSQVEQSRAATRLLIDALSPKRDCKRRADALTQ